MFPNNNFRGLSILPYPDHVKQLIDEVNRKNKKLHPGNKVHVYLGKEVIPEFDKKLMQKMTKQNQF